MTTEEKQERDGLIEKIKQTFEELHGYSPSVRRTKGGYLIFDEGSKNEIYTRNGFLGNALFKLTYGTKGLNDRVKT